MKPYRFIASGISIYYVLRYPMKKFGLMMILILLGMQKELSVIFRNNDIDKVKEEINNGLMYTRKRTHKTHVNTQTGFHSCNVAISCINSIKNGCNERDIISLFRDHYSAIHPTQKPVRLIERLIFLVSKEGDTVLDPFSGSGSTAIACLNTGRNFIGFEIDKEYYYDSAMKRIQEHQPKLAL